MSSHARDEPPWYERYKPAASRRTHLIVAALMWTLAGIGLSSFGLFLTVRAAGGGVVVALLAAAVLAGVVKGRFLLSRTARRYIARIERRGDGNCLGGFLSVWGWGLVVAMSVGGRLLRTSPATRQVLGPIYVAVGVALVVGSESFWRARRR